jgi:malonyl-CoA O-methyltransferase
MVEQALERTDFDRIVVTSEVETEYYADLHGLLRSIKRIGAGASAQGNKSRGGLGWRSILNEASRLYSERYESDGRIPATYEIIYVIARCGSEI